MNLTDFEFDDPWDHVVIKNAPRLRDIDQTEAIPIRESQKKAIIKLELRTVGYIREHGKESFVPGDVDDVQEVLFRRGYIAAKANQIQDAVMRDDLQFFEDFGIECAKIRRNIEANGHDRNPLGEFLADNWLSRDRTVPGFCFCSKKVLEAICRACVDPPLQPADEAAFSKAIDDCVGQRSRLGLLRAKNRKVAAAGWLGDDPIIQLAENSNILHREANARGVIYRAIC